MRWRWLSDEKRVQFNQRSRRDGVKETGGFALPQEWMQRAKQQQQ